jgi:uncharacterized membrane-anchored protein
VRGSEIQQRSSGAVYKKAIWEDSMNIKMQRRWALTFALLGGLLLSAGAALAQSETPAPSENDKAFEEARAVAQAGPRDIELAGQAKLHLPGGEVFIPQPQAARLMRAMGNPGEHSDLQGLIFPEQGSNHWLATLRYIAAGYVKDGDAKDWDAKELLKSYREGTEENNAERLKLGVPAIEIVGWAQEPRYDEATHRLVWAMATRDKDSAAKEDEQGVNYNTYALGREGYLSLNLITDLKDLPQYQGEAVKLLGALEFVDGKRYADFNSSTDKVAEYGLAALVLGVGAKKLGLLAVGFAFVAKFAKLIAIGALAFGGALTKFLRRKKPDAQA